MRIQLFGSSLLAVAALVGCGGDDGHIKVPDAKVFKDAAIDAPHMCLTMAALGSGSVGTMTAPATRQNFYKDAMSGTKYFGIKISLDNTATPDLVYFFVDEPTGGFLANVPYAFQTDPTAMTAAALTWLDADTDSMGNTTQELWPQTGSPASGINFTTMNTAMSGGTTPDVVAVINMTMFKEIDDAGALVAGGCASTLTGLNLYLKNSMPYPTRTAAPSDPTDPTVNPSGVATRMSKAEYLSHVQSMEAAGAAAVQLN